MGPFRFEFRLTPLDRYEPWDAARPVSWFELTDGEQIVRLGGQEIFATEAETKASWLDYSLARMWEDVLALVPYAKAPVPAEIARRIEPGAGWDRWCERACASMDCMDDETALELERAFTWANHRALDVGHLVAAPQLRFTTIDDIVIVTCEPRGDTRSLGWHWVCEPARVELAQEVFVTECERFAHTLVAQMDERVTAAANGALAGRAVVDPVSLREQHIRREAVLAAAFAPTAYEEEDWDRIDHALRTLDRAIGA